MYVIAKEGPTVPHSGSLSQFLWHESIKNIITPPGWDASLLEFTPSAFHHVSLTVLWCPFILLGGV